MPDIVAELRYAADDHDSTGYVMEKAAAEIERLRAAIQRIDGLNDNPARFNFEINKVCDEILRPHLA
jgi:hypothetical protein